MNQTVSNRTQQLQQRSEEWAVAEGQGDTAFFQRTLTDDFVGVGPLGFMLSKSDSIQRFTSGNSKYESFAWDDVKIRHRCGGDDGRQTQKAQYQDKVMEGQFRTTLIWVQQQGDWRLAGFHISPIAQGRP
jgi:hypothetical protein